MPNNKPHPNTVTDPNGSSYMTIEPSNPNAPPVVDLSQPPPHTELLIPPMKPGQILPPLIGPVGHLDSLRADPQILHEGDYTRPKYNPLTKT